ncbi:CRP/FNR family transcriptional regulator [Cytobacillus eiseniae]|uniref:CRP/FNR family transcriptional regulator n=1 Tax=Cytobacillus eiseniae TaxID=762947 RepID=A0ABS4RBU0_9BACI|nr:Crp/Fnr family transcriptional regulator [Cytobacillus eiseniae]MBP2240372.1 CRP/FNR family transcriptional regulator [Cytobacillus eiseniae]
MTEKNACALHHSHDSTHSHTACVSLVPIFNHLEREQMAEIMQAVHPVTYKKNEMIYHADDQSDSLYIVSKGKIRIYRLSELGKEQLVRILQPGDFTGELALFQDSVHVNYAEAMVETNVCVIKRAELQSFLLKYPSISLKILTEFANRLEQSEKQTTRFATEKVETRIALFLAEWTDGNNGEFELPMSKKDLASYLGTTPETISRHLTILEERGYIKKKKHRIIEILDLDGLLLV